MRKDTWVAAAYEAGLLGVAALLAFFFHSPLIFTSLGPTAYEMIETPDRPSARPYNILVGHGVGLVSGLLALGLLHAWAASPISVDGIPLIRVFAVVLAGFFTVAGTLWLKATQPAALSTALLVALGTMEARRAVMSIVVSIVIITAIGEPIRRIRANRNP